MPLLTRHMCVFLCVSVLFVTFMYLCDEEGDCLFVQAGPVFMNFSVCVFVSVRACAWVCLG